MTQYTCSQTCTDICVCVSIWCIIHCKYIYMLYWYAGDASQFLEYSSYNESGNSARSLRKPRWFLVGTQDSWSSHRNLKCPLQELYITCITRQKYPSLSNQLGYMIVQYILRSCTYWRSNIVMFQVLEDLRLFCVFLHCKVFSKVWNLPH